MNQQANTKNEVKPDIYQELGKLVSSVGDDKFLSNMHRFINTSLAVSHLELSEWTVDDSQATVSDVQLLGHAGIAEQLCLKKSSVETYLKRSAAKLGISGRHGLIKWLLCAE